MNLGALRKGILLFLLTTSSAWSATADWTLLLFMNGKSGMSRQVLRDLSRLEQSFGSDERVQVIVQYGVDSFPGGYRYRVERAPRSTEGKIHSPVLEVLEKADFGSADEFSEFIEWGMKSYPARRTLVLLKDHGRALSRDPEEALISEDFSTGRAMSVRGLADAVRSAARKSGRKIDVVALDICHGSSIEMAAQLADSVDYLIAGKLLTWDADFSYFEMARRLAKDSLISPELLAKSIADASHGRSGLSYSAEIGPFSAIDLRRMPGALAELRKFFGWLNQQSTGVLRQVLDESPLVGETEVPELRLWVRQTLNSFGEEALTRFPDLLPSLERLFLSDPGGVQIGGISIWRPFASRLDRGRNAGVDLESYRRFRFDRETGYFELLKRATRHRLQRAPSVPVQAPLRRNPASFVAGEVDERSRASVERLLRQGIVRAIRSETPIAEWSLSTEAVKTARAELRKTAYARNSERRQPDVEVRFISQGSPRFDSRDHSSTLVQYEARASSFGESLGRYSIRCYEYRNCLFERTRQDCVVFGADFQK